MKQKVLILNPNGSNVLLINPDLSELGQYTQEGAKVVENPDLRPFKGHPIEHLKMLPNGVLALKSEEEVQLLGSQPSSPKVDLNAFKAFLDGVVPEPVIQVVEKVIPVEVEGKPPREIIKEVIKEVPVEVIKEVIKEVPGEKIVLKEVVKTEQVAVVANPTVIKEEVKVEVVKYKLHKAAIITMALQALVIIGLLIKG